MNIDLESKRKKYDRIIKVIVTLLVGLVFGPLAIAAVSGLIGLVIAWLISEAVICFTPWMSMKFANWRVAAIKHEAAKNPIETLENQYAEKEQALVRFRDHIKAFYAEVQNFKTEIDEHKEKFPGKPCKFEPNFHKMVALLQNRSAKCTSSPPRNLLPSSRNTRATTAICSASATTSRMSPTRGSHKTSGTGRRITKASSTQCWQRRIQKSKITPPHASETASRIRRPASR